VWAEAQQAMIAVLHGAKIDALAVNGREARMVTIEG
jgi:hypothetical protein